MWPCHWESYWHFGGACYVHLQGCTRRISCMEEMVVLYRESARRGITRLRSQHYFPFKGQQTQALVSFFICLLLPAFFIFTPACCTVPLLSACYPNCVTHSPFNTTISSMQLTLGPPWRWRQRAPLKHQWHFTNWYWYFNLHQECCEYLRSDTLKQITKQSKMKILCHLIWYQKHTSQEKYKLQYYVYVTVAKFMTPVKLVHPLLTWMKKCDLV